MASKPARTLLGSHHQPCSLSSPDEGQAYRHHVWLVSPWLHLEVLKRGGAVYDVTRRETLDSLEDVWMNEVDTFKTLEDPATMVVGNKADLVRPVSCEPGRTRQVKWCTRNMMALPMAWQLSCLPCAGQCPLVPTEGVMAQLPAPDIFGHSLASMHAIRQPPKTLLPI